MYISHTLVAASALPWHSHAVVQECVCVMHLRGLHRFFCFASRVFFTAAASDVRCCCCYRSFAGVFVLVFLCAGHILMVSAAFYSSVR